MEENKTQSSKEIPSEDVRDEKWESKTICGACRVMKERLDSERNGECPAIGSRFSLVKTFLFYGAYFIVLTAIIVAVYVRLFPQESFLPLYWGGGSVFTAGVFLILGIFYCRNRLGALTEVFVSILTRTGIPLLAVLVIFSVIDKILLKRTLLTLVAFYLSVHPFEVWLLLPKRNEIEKNN